MRQSIITVALMCVVFCPTGCSDSDDRTGDETGTNSKGAGNGGGDGTPFIDLDSDGLNDNDGTPFVDLDSDGLNDGDVCHDDAADLTNVATRVLLLEDKSGSMDSDNKWEYAVEAISSMVTQFDTSIEFGLDLFSIDDGEGESCEVGESVIFDVAPGNSGPILNELAARGPGHATPLLAGMQNFLKANYAPVFQDGQAQSYLVIVSDGKDTCGLDGIYKNDDSATSEQLAGVTAELLNAHNIKTIVIGFGDGIDPDQLNAIARQGGTPFTEYLDAADGDELETVLHTIAETVVVSCTYRIGVVDTSVVNLDLVNVYFDNVAVPRDDGCSTGSGWTWVDDARTTIRFCEQSCAMLESGQVSEMSIKIMCNEDGVVVVVV